MEAVVGLRLAGARGNRRGNAFLLRPCEKQGLRRRCRRSVVPHEVDRCAWDLKCAWSSISPPQPHSAPVGDAHCANRPGRAHWGLYCSIS